MKLFRAGIHVVMAQVAFDLPDSQAIAIILLDSFGPDIPGDGRAEADNSHHGGHGT